MENQKETAEQSKDDVAASEVKESSSAAQANEETPDLEVNEEILDAAENFVHLINSLRKRKKNLCVMNQDNTVSYIPTVSGEITTRVCYLLSNMTSEEIKRI